MRKLSFIGLLLVFVFSATAQESPHGEKSKMKCVDCHTTDNWKYSEATAKFKHESTCFKLEGQHGNTTCAACHITLIFSDAKSNCIDCHIDMHNTSVGSNCAECHNSSSWIISNTTELHQMSRFPLLGAHNTAACIDCHKSVSQLEFEPLGVECIDCHRQDYLATSNPNHIQTNISTDCMECHRIEAHEWSASGINHEFFPLTKGHALPNCATCHTNGTSAPLSPECYSCHQNDYASTTNPPHQSSGFSTDCAQCHTTDPDWKPAAFDHDNQYFPIYSGEHRGEWNSCVDCHTQEGNYSVFSCIDCHEHNRSEMDDEHKDENDYVYNSISCLTCHPTGKSDD